jgi:hypothetical protein
MVAIPSSTAPPARWCSAAARPEGDSDRTATCGPIPSASMPSAAGSSACRLRHAEGRAQGRRGALQLPAERRQHRHRGLPVGVRVPATRCKALKEDGYTSTCRRRRRAALASSRATPRATAPCQRHSPASRPTITSARALSRRDRGPVGARRRASSRATAVHLRPRRAVRQRLRRRPAGLRLRGRPDAAAVRARLHADPRLQPPSIATCARTSAPRRAALRHPRRARVHARQAGRDVRQLLARSADRRSAELLPLRVEQPVRGHHRQAPRRRPRWSAT